jgi:hypothetical protein
MDDQEDPKDEQKPNVTLTGVVQKVIKPVGHDPEKVEIGILEADDLYKEIRIENALDDGDGEKVKLKPGAEVDVTIETKADDTEKKSA